MSILSKKDGDVMRYVLISFMLICSLLSAVSIYDIQYTTQPGDGTYPSSYAGQTVTTGGIVTATGFSNGRFFIEQSSGGAWRGLYVYSNDYEVSVGDSLIITAEVYEYNGFTELSYLSDLQIVSSGNALPQPAEIPTNDANTEMYESVLVKVINAVISEETDEWGYWRLDDGSGSCVTDGNFFTMESAGIPVMNGFPFDAVTGIMAYAWGEYHLNPRTIEDLQFDTESYIIATDDLFISSLETFTVPFQLIYQGAEQSAQNYQFELEYNSNVLNYSGYELVGTLSENGTITDNSSANSINLSFNGDFSYSQPETLINLNFSGIESGSGDLEFTSFNLNGNSVSYFDMGVLTIQANAVAIGDTLTVIQAPILNVPRMLTPGDSLRISCDAPDYTSNWQVSIIYNNQEIDLNLVYATYYRNERWHVCAEIPEQINNELYDLKVEANGIETDISENAVRILSNWKDSYYFVQITDSHLPTHLFYPDPEVHTDTTEVADFRAVIEDINLINPEFVVITGDLINEGEMEEFENRRVYSIAQNLLTEFEVPVYLVSGNHDIGGWDSSPPSQGTARRTWWKFFGWKWCQYPNTPFDSRTQDYSFNYGEDHYIGMEAYLNYDSYMFPVYGDESFTDQQMDWLNLNLEYAAAARNKVIFYHYDFSDQINLTNLDLDMALYGHIHSNEGSITSHPYNLATDNTCDGTRAFRVIRINEGVLQPTNTLYSGWEGEELELGFSPSNSGVADSVYALVENNFPQQFNDGLLKFVMPAGAEEYRVENGTLLQIDNSGDKTICYVNVVIPANGNIGVSVIAEMEVSSASTNVPAKRYELRNYPNPFNPTTTIRFSLNTEITENAEVEIYNAKGQKIKSIMCHPELACTERSRSEGRQTHSITWNGTDQNNKAVASGIYYSVLKVGNKQVARSKMILLK